MYSLSTSSAITTPQGKRLRQLLTTGRWNNKSEVVRYGLEPAWREVQQQDLAPIPDLVLAQCYARTESEECEADRAMSEASPAAQKAAR